MRARFDATLGSVDGFTVEAAGAEARYVLAEDTTGLDRFGPPQVAPAGDGPVNPAEVQLLAVQVPNVPRLAAGIRGAELEGPITRDGRRVYVLRTDDPGTLVGTPGAVPVDSARTPDLRVYVSAETFDVVEVYQSVMPDTSATEPVVSRLIYSDFRETDGAVLPWAVRQLQTGLDPGLSDDERMVMGGRLGLARRQAEAMPSGPERDAQLAALDAQERLLTEGVADLTLEIDAVRVEGAEE